MRLTSVCAVILLLETVAAGQSSSTDPQAAQPLLAEIRQLRQDLQTAATVTQRVQIVIFRLQVQTGQFNEAKQRPDWAHQRSNQTEERQRELPAQIEQAEAMKRDAREPVQQKNAESYLSNLK